MFVSYIPLTIILMKQIGRSPSSIRLLSAVGQLHLCCSWWWPVGDSCTTMLKVSAIAPGFTKRMSLLWGQLARKPQTRKMLKSDSPVSWYQGEMPICKLHGVWKSCYRNLDMKLENKCLTRSGVFKLSAIITGKRYIICQVANDNHI